MPQIHPVIRFPRNWRPLRIVHLLIALAYNRLEPTIRFQSSRHGKRFIMVLGVLICHMEHPLPNVFPDRLRIIHTDLCHAHMRGDGIVLTAPSLDLTQYDFATKQTIAS